MTPRGVFIGVLAASLSLAVPPAFAFNSGSTGADGAFAPTTSTQMPIQVPPSGIFNFTTVNVPTGVTVTFQKNAANTPVIILASGDVTIAGTISASGNASPAVGPAGNGNSADDGLPGTGGPGGYDGGPGGQMGANRTGGNGLGPGSGPGGVYVTSQPGCRSQGMANGGAGAGFAVQGGNSGNPCGQQPSISIGGPSYGASLSIPLIGGSGGGGGAGGTGIVASGGGGGGGAILIATSGTINVTGSVLANGGAGGASGGDGSGGTGGGGSGGAIRLMATTLTGNGTISATGGVGGGGVSDLLQAGNTYYSEQGGTAAVGRIRLEGDTNTRTAATTPPYTAGSPGPTAIAGQPTLTITSVAGVSAPASPTGVGDIQLPSSITNPVTVTLTTTGVPVGGTVTVRIAPSTGSITSVTSTALSGSTNSATATASVTLAQGASTLQAITTFTVLASLGDALSTYANNERVEKITLVATLGGKSEARLVTVSGKEFPAPAAALLALAN